jgi:hypothetical protein
MIDIVRVRGVSIKVWPVIDETADVHPDVLEAICKQINNDAESIVLYGTTKENVEEIDEN